MPLPLPVAPLPLIPPWRRLLELRREAEPRSLDGREEEKEREKDREREREEEERERDRDGEKEEMEIEDEDKERESGKEKGKRHRQAGAGRRRKERQTGPMDRGPTEQGRACHEHCAPQSCGEMKQRACRQVYHRPAAAATLAAASGPRGGPQHLKRYMLLSLKWPAPKSSLQAVRGS